MDDYRRLAVFVSVVDAGSFTEAASRLGITKSAVSKQVAELEKRHGVELLHRTTRSLRVTEAGRFVLRAARDMVAAAEAALEVLAEERDEPRGVLRITAPIGLGESLVAPRLAEFLAAHPRVSVELSLSDERTHLVDDRFDLAIRAARLADSSFVARKLAEVPLVVVAALAFLREHPVKRPSELAGYDVAVFEPLGSPMRLDFSRGRERQAVSVSGRLVTNHGPVTLRYALDGGGFAVLPRFYVADAIERGELAVALEEWSLGAIPVFALYSSRHQPARVRAFVEVLAT